MMMNAMNYFIIHSKIVKLWWYKNVYIPSISHDDDETHAYNNIHLATQTTTT